ncbi:serine hydrolase domain-containing protein [Yinghuangia sp. YIM S09857]|uniref:serine hydrolase domain-containing protein n=1 Tax=Yinghuangia sp. YIM S09857 TaxID=3436929 RepID=UPI003F531E62
MITHTRARARRTTITLAALGVVLTTAVPLAVADGTGTASAAAKPPKYGSADLRRDIQAVRDAVGGEVNIVARVDGADGTVRAAVGPERGLPANPYFRIASTTKTYLAVVVMQLASEGRLPLDDTVERWLPGVVSGNGNDGTRITVRHLLGHTSGLFDYMRDPGVRQRLMVDFEANRHDTTPPAELVSVAMSHPPAFTPGQAEDGSGVKWGYSNTDYLLAAMIAERASGATWRELIEARVIAPLGLRDTSIPGMNPFLPTPHVAITMTMPDGKTHDLTEHSIQHTADSGVVSTPADVNRFFQALAAGRLLPAEQWEQMRATPPGANGHGLGVQSVALSCGGTYYTHMGDGLGAASRLGVTADGTRAVSLSVTAAGGDRPDTGKLNAAAATAIDRALCAGALR